MYDFLRPGVSASNARRNSGAASSLACNSSGTAYSEAFFRRTFFLDLDGFVNVLPQNREVSNGRFREVSAACKAVALPADLHAHANSMITKD